MGKSNKARTGKARRSAKVTHAFFDMDDGWKSTTPDPCAPSLTVTSTIRAATAAETTMLDAKIGLRGDDNNSTSANPTNLDSHTLRLAKAAAPFTQSNSKFLGPDTQVTVTSGWENNSTEIVYRSPHMGDYPVSYPPLENEIPRIWPSASVAGIPRTNIPADKMAAIKTDADKIAAIQNAISHPATTETLLPIQQPSAQDLLSTGISKISINDPAFKKLETAAAALAKMAQNPNALAERFGFTDEDAIEAIKQLFYPIPSPKPTGIPVAEEKEGNAAKTELPKKSQSEFYAVPCTSDHTGKKCDWECSECVFKRKFFAFKLAESEKENGTKDEGVGVDETKSSLDVLNSPMIPFKRKIQVYPDSCVQMFAWLASTWVLEDKSRLTKGIVRQFAEYLRKAYPIRKVNLVEEKEGCTDGKSKEAVKAHNKQIKRFKQSGIEEGSAISFSPDIVKWIMAMEMMGHSFLRRLRPYIFQQGVVDGKRMEVYAKIWFHSSNGNGDLCLERAYEEMAFVLLNSMLAMKYKLQPWNTGDQLFFTLTEKAVVGVFVDLYRVESEGGLDGWDKRRKLALDHWRVEGKVGWVAGGLNLGGKPGAGGRAGGEKRGDRIMLLKEMTDGC